VSMLT